MVVYLSNNLKSNMDRFIEILTTSQFFDFLYLKSNMDRFIELLRQCCHFCTAYLKSNMDRFIVFNKKGYVK